MLTPAMKVLVADDNAVALEVLAALIRPEGYEVLTAGGGQECLDVADRLLPDVVLLDVMMPDLNGYEVCRRIRTNPAIDRAIVIMVTALHDRQSRLAAFEAGSDDFISKPVDRLELVLRLRTLARLNRFSLLLQERSQLEELSRLSPDAVLALDASASIVSLNDAARAMLGADVGASLPASFVGQSHHDWQRAWAALHQPTGLSRPTVRIESVMSGESGSFPGEMILGRVAPGLGQVAAIAIVRNMTSFVTLRTRLLAAQRFESIARVSSGIAHDFGNILFAIRGALCSATQAGSPGTASAEGVSASLALVREGEALVKRLNSLAHTDVDAAVPLDVAAEVRGMAPLLRHLADGASVLNELPETAAWVVIDATEVRQVLANLVSNARDAAGPDGRIVIRLERSTSVPPSAGYAWCLVVEDDGCGMAPQVLEQVFELYFTTKGTTGTGLGLPTVRAIAERRGGYVSIRTAEGQGTAIHVFLPEAPASPVGAPSGPESL